MSASPSSQPGPGLGAEGAGAGASAPPPAAPANGREHPHAHNRGPHGPADGGAGGPDGHEHITPGDTYQVDSDEFDSSDAESIAEDEYDALVAEADAGYSEDEVAALVARLKEDGLVNFLRWYLAPTEPPRSLRKLLIGLGIVPPRYLRSPGTPDMFLLPFTKVALSRVLRRRAKLQQYNSVGDAIELLRNAKRIMVLSGAGISTSCGIPDFRSATGLYANLQAEGKYDLDDPQQMFDIAYFREHPEVFFSFAKQIYPSNFVPSPCHRWIKLLEDRGVLLRNYTQNIDTLESQAGVTRVLQCHGSFRTASCLRCKVQLSGEAIEKYIMEQRIAYCPSCSAERDAQIAAAKAHRESVRKKKKGGWDGDDDSDSDFDPWARGEPGIVKPDIVFFGQALDSAFDEALFADREDVDLLVVVGTSLKVAPVSEVLSHIPHSVPQIFINLTPVTHMRPDILLLGDADSIVTYLSRELGWEIPPAAGAKPLAVTPDDATWVSGEGEWAHLHMLRSRAEREAMALSGQTIRLTVGSESESESGDEGREGEDGADAAGAAEGAEGADEDGLRPPMSRVSSSRSDRPAKRSRMGSPASGDSEPEQAKRSRVGTPVLDTAPDPAPEGGGGPAVP